MPNPENEVHLEKTNSQDGVDLNALLETSKILNSSEDLDFILSHILRTVMGKFMLKKACVITIAGSDSPEKNPKYVIKTQRGMHSIPDCLDSLEGFCHAQDIQSLVPIVSGQKQIGYIGLGKKFSGFDLSESEKSFVDSLASLTASAIYNALVLSELRKTNQHLNRKVQQLKTLFELSNEYRVDLERKDIIKLLARSLSGQLVVKNYLVCSKQSESVQIELKKGVYSESLSLEELESLFSFTFPELLSDKTFPSLCSAGLKVAVPLRNDDSTLGVFLCTERLNKIPFSESDLEFMHLAAAQAANAIEQARLFKETLEIRVLEAELELAREIQQNLFPEEIPAHKHFDIAAGTHPSRQVGGDYYDLIKMDENHFFIAIADVSGKGSPASLLMSNLQAMIKAYMEFLRAGKLSLTDMMGKINNIIYEN
ncbi:MAG: GAF domain-containing protein, partial [Chlorobiales bacterium]|nr:GAF domain-containing protein [Chlorobiales bacterium]